MPPLRIIALVISLAVLATACEEGLFTAEPPPAVVTETPTDGGDDGGATDGAATDDGSTDGSAAPTDDPVVGCGLDVFAGDSAFTELVCQYQATLIQALSAGVTLDSQLTDQVSDALLLWVADPSGAYDIVSGAISQIDALIDAAVPVITTSTVGDVTDNLFDCISQASALLQEAFQRIEVGGVVIPEMDSWQATFDEASRLAGEGDVVGATALVCSLNDEMDAVLYQS